MIKDKIELDELLENMEEYCTQHCNPCSQDIKHAADCWSACNVYAIRQCIDFYRKMFPNLKRKPC